MLKRPSKGRQEDAVSGNIHRLFLLIPLKTPSFFPNEGVFFVAPLTFLGNPGFQRVCSPQIPLISALKWQKKVINTTLVL